MEFCLNFIWFIEYHAQYHWTSDKVNNLRIFVVSKYFACTFLTLSSCPSEPLVFHSGVYWIKCDYHMKTSIFLSLWGQDNVCASSSSICCNRQGVCMSSFGDYVILMLLLYFVKSKMFKLMILKYFWKLFGLFDTFKNDKNGSYFFLDFLYLFDHFLIKLRFFHIIHGLTDSLIGEMGRNVFYINVVNVFNLLSLLIRTHCTSNTKNFFV